ncbi:sensor histidine kinase [Candidatus Pacearchaeota archaeon]|nr:sensor histidine kinase [Candidatus Pacearchaeota archaeon]
MEIEKIAHEIINNLTKILDIILLLKKNYVCIENEGNEEMEMAIEEVRKASEEARRMCKWWNDFERLVTPNLVSANLGAVVKNAVNYFKRSLPENIKISVISDDTIATVDSPQIRAVLFNLIKNAAQAMSDKGGRIEIQVKRIEIQNRYFGQIVVKDNGPGIPKEIQSKIFNAVISTKKPGEGMGLGLSIVWDMIKAHKGATRFTSQTGENSFTEFKIILPAIDVEKLSEK